MKVIGLHAENVKRLKAVELKVDTQGGGLVVISGRNGQGKSSLLDSIAYALGGKRLIPDEPIRKGAKSATVEVILDGDDVEHGPWKVTRKFTKKGSTIRVQNEAGVVFGSPQQLLDSFLGNLTFDPLEFMNLKPKEQREALLKTVDLEIDLDANAGRYAALYEKRKLLNRDGKRLEGALSLMDDIPEGTPTTEVSVAALAAALEKAQKHNAHIQDLRHDHLVETTAVANLRARMTELLIQLEASESTAAMCAGELQKLTPVDEEPIRQAMETAEETNADVRKRQERVCIKGELAEAKEQSEATSIHMRSCMERRDEALEAAQFPVPGLSVDEETVTYGGIALSEAAQSEQLKVSVGIAMALQPKLRIVRITDGSLLDTESMAELEELAKEHDYDVWIERVSDGEQVGIVIEDGEIKEGTDEGS